MATRRVAGTRKPYAPEAGLTPARRAKALEQMRTTGVFEHAARAAGVTHTALHQWRKKHPDFDAELREAQECVIARAGTKAIHALEQHVDGVLAGERYEDKYAPAPGLPGERILVQRGDKVPLNVAAARTLLTGYAPRFTHPKQEVEHSGTLTVAEAVKAARERMAEGEGG